MYFDLCGNRNPISGVDVKLYSIYTDEMLDLKNTFLESVKDDWDLTLDRFEGGGHVLDEGWYDILKDRTVYIVNKIKENMGQVIVWCDIDVQFFRPCIQFIEEAIKDKDIVFLDEGRNGHVNCGFVVIRCNEKTLALYEKVLQTDLKKHRLGDQGIINWMLLHEPTDLNWGVLPKQFWARSQGGVPPKDAVMHHANNTFASCFPFKRESLSWKNTTDLKIAQLKNMKHYIEMSKNPKVLVVLITRKETPNAETLAALDSLMKQDYENFSVIQSFAQWTLDDDFVENKYANIRLHMQTSKKIALASDADYFLLLDSDITLLPNAISSLVSRNKDVIGGWFRLESIWIDRWWNGLSEDMKKQINYAKLRRLNRRYNGGRWDKQHEFMLLPDIEPGVSEVDIIDFGCTLISRNAYEKVSYKEGEGVYGGIVCLSFATELQAAGYKLFMDSDVQCKHKGWEPREQLCL